MLSGERLSTYPSRSRTRQGCSLSLLLFSIVLEVQQMQEGKKNKIVPICSQNDCLCRKCQIIYKNPRTNVFKFSKVTGYQVNAQNLIVFLYSSNEQLATKIFKKYHNSPIPTNEISRYKSIKICTVFMCQKLQN